MRVSFNVLSMTCNHCKHKIQTFLNEVKGVLDIDINLKSKIVNVDFEAPASIDSIKEAILDAGFEPIEISQ